MFCSVQSQKSLRRRTHRRGPWGWFIVELVLVLGCSVTTTLYGLDSENNAKGIFLVWLSFFFSSFFFPLLLFFYILFFLSFFLSPSLLPGELTLQAKSPDLTPPSHGNVEAVLQLDLIFKPSPGQVIFAYILLGCSISSFIFRHREKDHSQIFVFFAMIISVITLARTFHASIDLTITAFIPWACLASMLLSKCGHATVRRLQRRASSARAENLVKSESEA
jgi:ABC-type iron transport system FetAB permease component